MFIGNVLSFLRTFHSIAILVLLVRRAIMLTDGAVPIDNNISEREMKRVVLNRKNSLFVGNPSGGRIAAILASLTSTCHRHDVDPRLYTTQLFINLPVAQMSELAAWLPDQWETRQAARLPAR
jgi:transposase